MKTTRRRLLGLLGIGAAAAAVGVGEAKAVDAAPVLVRDPGNLRFVPSGTEVLRVTGATTYEGGIRVTTGSLTVGGSAPYGYVVQPDPAYAPELFMDGPRRFEVQPKSMMVVHGTVRPATPNEALNDLLTHMEGMDLIAAKRPA